jgi:hypothetical protein
MLMARVDNKSLELSPQVVVRIEGMSLPWFASRW